MDPPPDFNVFSTENIKEPALLSLFFACVYCGIHVISERFLVQPFVAKDLLRKLSFKDRFYLPEKYLSYTTNFIHFLVEFVLRWMVCLLAFLQFTFWQLSHVLEKSLAYLNIIHEFFTMSFHHLLGIQYMMFLNIL